MASLTLLLLSVAFVSHTVIPIVNVLYTMAMTNQQAVDVVEIQQVVNLFAIAIDQYRLELLPQIFSSDVAANFSVPSGMVQSGLDEVTQLLSTLQAIPSLHYQSTDYISFPSLNQAHATTYLTGTFFGSGKLQGQVYLNYGQ